MRNSVPRQKVMSETRNLGVELKYFEKLVFFLKKTQENTPPNSFLLVLRGFTPEFSDFQSPKRRVLRRARQILMRYSMPWQKVMSETRNSGVELKYFEKSGFFY